MSFTQKLLSVSITLQQGVFGSGGNNVTIAAENSPEAFADVNMLQNILRMSAHIDVVGGVSSGNMELAIYGLPLTLMNQLSTIGTQINLMDKNTISVSAGDKDALNLVFSGLIHEAYVDANNMPQVCFRISAVPGGQVNAVMPVKPISLSGSQDVGQIMGSLAKQMGLTLENNGVKVKIMNPYYSGSPWRQAVQLMQHANIEMIIDKGKLAITPPGQPREGQSATVSAQTGMIGYPAFRQNVILVKSIFNPAIQCGGSINVQSALTPANGSWKVFHIVYDLECAMPHGRWQQLMEGTTTGETPA